MESTQTTNDTATATAKDGVKEYGIDSTPDFGALTENETNALAVIVSDTGMQVSRDAEVTAMLAYIKGAASWTPAQRAHAIERSTSAESVSWILRSSIVTAYVREAQADKTAGKQSQIDIAGVSRDDYPSLYAIKSAYDEADARMRRDGIVALNIRPTVSQYTKVETTLQALTERLEAKTLTGNIPSITFWKHLATHVVPMRGDKIGWSMDEVCELIAYTSVTPEVTHSVFRDLLDEITRGKLQGFTGKNAAIEYLNRQAAIETQRMADLEATLAQAREKIAAEQARKDELQAKSDRIALIGQIARDNAVTKAMSEGVNDVNELARIGALAELEAKTATIKADTAAKRLASIAAKKAEIEKAEENVTSDNTGNTTARKPATVPQTGVRPSTDKGDDVPQSDGTSQAQPDEADSGFDVIGTSTDELSVAFDRALELVLPDNLSIETLNAITELVGGYTTPKAFWGKVIRSVQNRTVMPCPASGLFACSDEVQAELAQDETQPDAAQPVE